MAHLTTILEKQYESENFQLFHAQSYLTALEDLGYGEKHFQFIPFTWNVLLAAPEHYLVSTFHCQLFMVALLKLLNSKTSHIKLSYRQNFKISTLPHIWHLDSIQFG